MLGQRRWRWANINPSPVLSDLNIIIFIIIRFIKPPVSMDSRAMRFRIGIFFCVLKNEALNLAMSVTALKDQMA